MFCGETDVLIYLGGLDRREREEIISAIYYWWEPSSQDARFGSWTLSHWIYVLLRLLVSLPQPLPRPVCIPSKIKNDLRNKTYWRFSALGAEVG